MQNLLTIPELCTTLKCGRTRAYQLMNAGHIKAVKMGKSTLIERSSIDEFIATLPTYNGGQAQ